MIVTKARVNELKNKAVDTVNTQHESVHFCNMNYRPFVDDLNIESHPDPQRNLIETNAVRAFYRLYLSECVGKQILFNRKILKENGHLGENGEITEETRKVFCNGIEVSKSAHLSAIEIAELKKLNFDFEKIREHYYSIIARNSELNAAQLSDEDFDIEKSNKNLFTLKLKSNINIARVDDIALYNFLKNKFPENVSYSLDVKNNKIELSIYSEDINKLKEISFGGLNEEIRKKEVLWDEQPDVANDDESLDLGDKHVGETPDVTNDDESLDLDDKHVGEIPEVASVTNDQRWRPYEYSNERSETMYDAPNYEARSLEKRNIFIRFFRAICNFLYKLSCCLFCCFMVIDSSDVEERAAPNRVMQNVVVEPPRDLIICAKIIEKSDLVDVEDGSYRLNLRVEVDFTCSTDTIENFLSTRFAGGDYNYGNINVDNENKKATFDLFIPSDNNLANKNVADSMLREIRDSQHYMNFNNSNSVP